MYDLFLDVFEAGHICSRQDRCAATEPLGFGTTLSSDWDDLPKLTTLCQVAKALTWKLCRQPVQDCLAWTVGWMLWARCCCMTTLQWRQAFPHWKNNLADLAAAVKHMTCWPSRHLQLQLSSEWQRLKTFCQSSPSHLDAAQTRMKNNEKEVDAWST